MHIIVIGCGKVGSKLGRLMADQGHDVVIVDSDPNSFKSLGPGFNGVTVTGVPIDQDVLKQAGIETADALAAVTPDDNVNVMACQVAKEIFKISRVIARIYNPSREHVFHQFGLETICPTNITADIICSMLLKEDGISEHSIGNTSFCFKHARVDKGTEGKRLDSIKTDSNTSVFGVLRNGQFEFVHPDLILQKDDTLVIAEKID